MRNLAGFALMTAALPANLAIAQNVAQLPVFGEVEPAEALEIDGIWKVVGLGKRVLIEKGHSYVLDPWVHLFTVKVDKGQVVSTSITRAGPRTFSAYDNLLQQRMIWRVNADRSISASGSGFLAPSFRMEPVELARPRAFEDMLEKVPGGPDEGPDSRPPAGRPGPLTQLPVGTYWLTNALGKCMDLVDTQRTSQGGRIQVWDCKSNANQEWGYYARQGQIISGSGMCLEAAGSSKGAAVRTFGCDGRPEQRWRRQRLENRMYAFVNDATGMCLDAARPTARNNGGRVIQWDCHFGATQSWRIRR
ncbi:MAG: RICIN domain-containing protein [Novosphingobium sp.]